MAGIYRKKAIDRLSSPEQLDKMIPITQPSTWLILLGVFVIFLAAGLWVFLGEITETYSMNGITIMSDTKFEEVSDENDMLLCFMPQRDVGKVTIGMQITAKTENNEQLHGTIVQLDSYITPNDEVLNLLQNEVLASYFTSDGPVLAVRCKINEEAVTLGSLAQVEVIIRSTHPITYVFSAE